jgi:hypothetical protein
VVISTSPPSFGNVEPANPPTGLVSKLITKGIEHRVRFLPAFDDSCERVAGFDRDVEERTERPRGAEPVACTEQRTALVGVERGERVDERRLADPSLA